MFPANNGQMTIKLNGIGGAGNSNHGSSNGEGKTQSEEDNSPSIINPKSKLGRSAENNN
jgi:hypothetical protein